MLMGWGLWGARDGLRGRRRSGLGGWWGRLRGRQRGVTRKCGCDQHLYQVDGGFGLPPDHAGLHRLVESLIDVAFQDEVAPAAAEAPQQGCQIDIGHWGGHR